MYLTAYHFQGTLDELLPAYEQMTTAFPPESLSFHVCVTSELGITVFDGCPSAEIAQAFRTSPEFAATLAAVGLPEPRVEALGDIHRFIVNEPVGG